MDRETQQKLPRTVARLEPETREKLNLLMMKWRRSNVSEAIAHMIDECYKLEFHDE